ncbi:hypothetical protein C8Q79DRAFT_920474 [Trametes meyenii]|nr:hypothetical protein C8Q79DRAFT_920474 [Trametes meyenii]
MSKHVLRQHLVELPKDLPFFENQEEYVNVRHSCIFDYHSFPTPRQQHIDCSTHLSNVPFEVAATALERGDPEAIIDLGLRYSTGCTVSANVEQSLDTWEAITNSHHPYALPNDKLTPSVLARTYSLLAETYRKLSDIAFDGFSVVRAATPLYPDRVLPNGEDDEYMPNGFLFLSAFYAEATVAWGLVSPAVLNIARHLIRAGEPQKLDIRNTPRYKRFVRLWRAYDTRQEEMARERRVYEAKTARAPNAYICAAQGCGITSKQKKGLMRCAGKCPPERKPHYCSKDCQRRDWGYHKHFCKPDSQIDHAAAESAPIPTDGPPVGLGGALALDTDSPTIDWNVLQPTVVEGPDRSIEVPIPGRPGETVTLYSRNLTPTAMRFMRDVMAAQVAERAGVGAFDGA